MWSNVLYKFILLVLIERGPHSTVGPAKPTKQRLITMNVNKLLELMESKDKKNLEELGGVDGLAKSLGSDVNKGILATTEQDLNERKQQYGENVLQRKPPPSVLDMFLEAIQDTTLVILMIAAVY